MESALLTALPVLAASISTTLVLRWMRSRAPATAVTNERKDDLPTLRKKYEPAEIRLAMLLLVTFPVSFWCFYKAQRALAPTAPDGLPDAVIRLLPGAIEWSLLAFFGGILLAFPISEIFLRLYLKSSYGEFNIYQQLKYRIDSTKITIPFVTVFASLLIIGAYVLGDFYVATGPDKVVVNPLFSFTERRYNLDQVRRIRRSWKSRPLVGELVEHPKPRYIIELPDLQVKSWYLPGTTPEQGAFVEHIQNRSAIEFSDEEIFQ